MMPSILRRGPAVPLLVLAAGIALVVLRLDEMPVGALHDDAIYVETARSLAEGRGPVLYLNERDGPVAPRVYPPGFPLLLAPLARLRPDSLEILKAVPLLAWFALGLLAWRVPAPGSPRTRRVAVALLVLVNPWTVGHAGRILSDLPFAACALAALLAARANGGAVPTRGRIVLAGLLAAAAVALRAVGWAVCGAVLLHLALHRRWGRLALFALAAAVPLAALQAGFGPYGAGILPPAALDQVVRSGDASRLGLLAGNLAGYLAQLPVVLVPVFGAPVRALAERAGLGGLTAPLGVLAGLGLAAAIVRGRTAPGSGWRDDPGNLFLAVYLVVLLNFHGWPSGVQARLLLPVLPLLLDGLIAWAEGSGRTVRGIAAAALVAGVMGAAALAHDAYRATRPALEPIYDPSVGSAWIRGHTAPDATILVRMPLRQHIHYRRPTAGWGEAGPDSLAAVVDRYGAGWIVLGPRPVSGEPTTAAVAAAVRRDPARYPEVHREGGGRLAVHRVVRPGGDGPVP